MFRKNTLPNGPSKSHDSGFLWCVIDEITRPSMSAGDVVGPAFPEVPVGTDNLLGLEVMGAETAAFNFAANLWSLHYLRLTNQIQPGITYEVSCGGTRAARL